MTPAPIDEVVDLLRTLRLPHMRAAAPELLATAKAQRQEPAEAMRALLGEELAGRQASSVRARREAAGFPTGKTFDAWDETVSSIPAPTQRALRTLEWIHRHENLVVCGPSPTAKTHFLEALGHTAVDAGHKVTWFSLEHLGALVRRHGADDTAAKAIKRIMRADVIAIDDIGLLPVTTDTAEALYRVVDAAYEKRSIALSSNLHPAGFDELIPKTIANATVDRLLHHAHVVMTAGDSIRLTQATAGKAVTPLTNWATGRTPGHHRAVPLATAGQFYCPPPGRSHWPLTDEQDPWGLRVPGLGRDGARTPTPWTSSGLRIHPGGSEALAADRTRRRRDQAHGIDGKIGRLDGGFQLPRRDAWRGPRAVQSATSSQVQPEQGGATSKPRLNEHGAEITLQRIFSWNELDGVRWDDEQVDAQIVTGEHMHLIRAVYEPGTTYPMHSHPHEQFSLLLSGRLLLRVGDETREIGPGDGWYAPADVPHGGEVLGGDPAVFIDVYSPATAWILEVFATGRRIPAGERTGADPQG